MSKRYKESYPSGDDVNNILESRKELIRIVRQLRSMLAEVSWYMTHNFGCDVEQTDCCTCGKSETKRRARRLYDETANL